MFKFTMSFKTEDISTELRITDEGEVINTIILSRITKNYNACHTQHK